MELISNGITANIVAVLVAIYAYIYLKGVKNRESKLFIFGVILIAVSGVVQAVGVVVCIHAFRRSAKNA